MNSSKLAAAVINAWNPAAESSDGAAGRSEALPQQAVVETLLSTCFEVSLLREENRPLRFRLILRDPELFSPLVGPPEGLHRLVFSEPRRFTAHELRRLAPAVDYEHSMVGVMLDPAGALRIWGIVQSGTRWLEQFRGGRGNGSALPPSLIIGVSDPGYMSISQGSRPLAAVEAGALQANHLNVFNSRWLVDTFSTIRHELHELHNEHKRASGAAWSAIDSDLTRMVARQMLQRLISTVQRARHGGTLLIVPPERAAELLTENQWVHIKYKFKEEEPRARFRSLIVRVMDVLASIGARATPPMESVGWRDYVNARDRQLNDLDEAIFEMSHMIASFTAVDGAVVLTKRFELLGLGGEIAGALSEVHSVARALDLEGDSYVMESTDDVGMRHRSVYRLINASRDVLGIVISQDGGARIVRWKGPHVMYWNHGTFSPS